VFYVRYESSGYEDASFRKVYHSSPYPKKLSTPKQSFLQQQQHFTSQQQHQVVGDGNTQQTQQQQQHTIESGPSFNESLERFRLATSSGGESDGESHLAGNSNQQTTSVFRQSRSSTQKTSSNLTSRSVEEQRTIITRNSQKSYHIE